MFIFIRIEGEIEIGDSEKFIHAVSGLPLLMAVVTFNSPGGSLEDGLKIGKEINMRGYLRFVVTYHRHRHHHRRPAAPGASLQCRRARSDPTPDLGPGRKRYSLHERTENCRLGSLLRYLMPCWSAHLYPAV